MDDLTPAPDGGRATASTAHDLRAAAVHALRTQYPYMKTGTLDKVLDEAQSHFLDKPLEQTTEHQEAEPRTSFLSLSGELRNSIYDMALEDHHKLTRQIHPRSIGENPDLTHLSDTRPALLVVSKQVREEAMSLYYDRPIFAWLKSFSGVIREYLRTIGVEQAAMIKTIKLRLPTAYFNLYLCFALQENNSEKIWSMLENMLQEEELLDIGVKPEAWRLQYDQNYVGSRTGGCREGGTREWGRDGHS